MRVGSERSWVGRDLEHVYNEEKENDELWTDYIELHMQRLFHSPFWDIRLCTGFPWIGCYVVSITPCTPRNSTPVTNTFLVFSKQARTTPQPPVSYSILSKFFDTAHGQLHSSWLKKDSPKYRFRLAFCRNQRLILHA